jgi:hypothetical protein
VAAALVDGPSSGSEPLNRFLFTTSTGGDVAGTQQTLSLSTPKRVLTEPKQGHKKASFSVRINGTLSGAIGGEEIVISRRALGGGAWAHQRVVAGANRGSFTTTWKVTTSTVFVAQWSGDSGRPGQGSAALEVIVSNSRRAPGPRKKR